MTNASSLKLSARRSPHRENRFARASAIRLESIPSKLRRRSSAPRSIRTRALRRSRPRFCPPFRRALAPLLPANRRRRPRCLNFPKSNRSAGFSLAPLSAEQSCTRGSAQEPPTPRADRFFPRARGPPNNQLSRRAKYLIVEFDGDDVLLVHLGMSGSLTIAAQFPRRRIPIPRHDHLEFSLDDDSRLFTTIRGRFRHGAPDCARHIGFTAS